MRMCACVVYAGWEKNGYWLYREMADVDGDGILCASKSRCVIQLKEDGKIPALDKWIVES